MAYIQRGGAWKIIYKAGVEDHQPFSIYWRAIKWSRDLRFWSYSYRPILPSRQPPHLHSPPQPMLAPLGPDLVGLHRPALLVLSLLLPLNTMAGAVWYGTMPPRILWIIWLGDFCWWELDSSTIIGPSTPQVRSQREGGHTPQFALRDWTSCVPDKEKQNMLDGTWGRLR